MIALISLLEAPGGIWTLFFSCRRGVSGVQDVKTAMQIVYVDKDRCLGCFNCERACALHRFARDGNAQSYIRVDVDFESRIVMTSTCRQCRNAACARACPSGALVKNHSTGIIEVALEVCIGCGKCEQACPSGNVRIIPDVGVAGKCDLCSGEPQCVQSCFARALLFGSLEEVARLIKAGHQGHYAIRAIGEADAEASPRPDDTQD